MKTTKDKLYEKVNKVLAGSSPTDCFLIINEIVVDQLTEAHSRGFHNESVVTAAFLIQELSSFIETVSRKEIEESKTKKES